MSECFLGEIRLFAGNYNPEYWALCDGALVPINENNALFSLIGTTYGGDGTTTFGLPDLRGRVPVGQGTGPGLTTRIIAQKAGEETHRLTAAEMPAHSHAIIASAAMASGQAVGPSMLYGQVQPAGNVNGLYTTAGGSSATAVQLDAKAVSFAGGDQPHDNMMTTTAISFIIALQGIYPPRQ